MKSITSDRRKFIRKSILASLSLPLLQMSCANGNSSEKTASDKPAVKEAAPLKIPYLETIGLQLYTVRNQMAEDKMATLKAVKEAGYYQVEMGDMESSDEIYTMAKEAGLEVKGSFFNWNYLLGNWKNIGREKPTDLNFDKILEKANKQGLEYLVFGYLTKEDRKTADDWKKIIDILNPAAEKCKEAGITLSYHNHSFEFGKVDDQIPFEMLIEGLDPKGVQFELDIFWAQIGGYDPVKLINRLDGRLNLLHLKDKRKGSGIIHDEAKVPKDAFKELGAGEVNVLACMEAGKNAGVKYCHVEQDQSPDPIASINQSIKYLKG